MVFVEAQRRYRQDRQDPRPHHMNLPEAALAVEAEPATAKVEEDPVGKMPPRKITPAMAP